MSTAPISTTVTSSMAPTTAPETTLDSAAPTTLAETTTTVPPGPLADVPAEPGVPSLVSDDVGFSPGSVLLGLAPADQARDLDRMVELGATWIRIDVDWSRVEPEPGRFDWSNLDGLVRGSRQRGLHILGLLTYTPAWARPDGTPDKAPPIDTEDFAVFVSEAVGRYSEHIRAWEIWNEPNVSSFWHPAPDPQGYVELLLPAAAAIRSADPDAIVVTGGLAPAVDDPGEEISPATFLAQLYESAPLDAFDAVGIHPYTYPGFPTEQQDWNTFAALPALRQLMDDRADAETPMWFTEYGAPTGNGRRSVSETDQARMIEEAILEARQWDWTGPLFVYSLRDITGGATDDIEANFGVLDTDGAPKPAAEVLRALLRAAPSE